MYFLINGFLVHDVGIHVGQSRLHAVNSMGVCLAHKEMLQLPRDQLLLRQF